MLTLKDTEIIVFINNKSFHLWYDILIFKKYLLENNILSKEILDNLDTIKDISLLLTDEFTYYKCLYDLIIERLDSFEKKFSKYSKYTLLKDSISFEKEILKVYFDKELEKQSDKTIFTEVFPHMATRENIRKDYIFMGFDSPNVN